MGIEPFVGTDANAFTPLIASTPDPAANLEHAIAFKLGIGQKQAEIGQTNAQTQQLQSQTAALAEKAQRAQSFQQDIEAVGNNPDANAISRLITKYPEFADQLKQGWEVKDAATKSADLTHLGEVYSAAASGNWDLAAQQAQGRIDADKAAGRADPSDDAMLAQINAAKGGDENAKKQVLTLLGTHIAAVTGPDHFASVYGALKGGYTLDAGAVRFDDNGNVVAQSPYIKGPDGSIAEKDGGAGGGSGGGTAAPSSSGTVGPAAASVASALSASGLPAPVVAGFMGNFHVEGGYTGAKGDGGSASGIGQWHSDRAANFQRVIGKPVTDATPAEQARFVKWEMDNPEAAGMTVKQRDAILAAKTPAQAAALIDQFYERSSGKDRQLRMAAATSFAGDSSGTRSPSATSDGSGGTQAAPAGYHWLVPPKSEEHFQVLSPAQVQQRGLDPSQQWQVNTKTGQIAGLGKAAQGSSAPPGNADLSGPQYVADLHRTNPSLAAQVQGVLDTRLAYPPATARSPQAQQLRAAVLQADPSYDEQAYARRKTTIQQYTPGHAGPGQSMLSAATLINHMYEMAQAARDLPDHATRLQNGLSAWWGNETNAPWLIKYNEGRKFVSSELPKFLNGKAPTEGEQQEHMGSYDPSKGKTGILTALGTDIDYMFGRYQPLVQAYKDSTGKDLNIDNYAPGQATRAKVAALEYYRANGALPTVVTNPVQARKLPHGAVFVTPDGRVLQRH